MVILALCAIAALTIAFFRLASRVRELETRFSTLAAERMDLSRQVRRLEHVALAPRSAVISPAAPSPAEPFTPHTAEAPTAPVPERESPSRESVPFVAPAEAASFPLNPIPTLSDRLRGFFSNEEWEALVGGSVLNKLGAIVLVVGIALFLAYSWTHMSAAGRAFLAYSAALAILGAGVWSERKPTYRTFARGLIAAGWAALYATTYAIWAIPAALILPDPFAGSLALLAVAGGMIAHSLVYRSQSATGVAYAAAFAALAATPSSPLAVVALIPLAGSLLYIAARFAWYYIALGGLAATWATFISQGASSASLLTAQLLIAAYWLLFELFDFLRVRRRALAGGVEWIYPLNLAAFASISWRLWAHQPHRFWLVAAWGSAVFCIDSIVRAYLRPPSSFGTDAKLRERIRQGSFEGSAFVSALLGGLAIAGRVPGLWATAGLALEAEALYLAGAALRSQFLEALGGAAFLWSLFRIPITPASYGKTPILGHQVWNWTPAALLEAFLFYFNRALRLRPVFSYAAAFLVAAVLAAEAQPAWAGTCWVLYGLVLFEIAFRRGLDDFRRQSYGLMFAGTLLAAAANAPGPYARWQPLAIALAAVYACALRSRSRADHRRAFAYGASAAVTVLAITLLWLTAPAGYQGAAVCVLSIVLLELGAAALPAELVHFFGPALFIGAIGVFAAHPAPVKHPSTDVWLSLFVASGSGSCALARWVLHPPSNAGETETSILRVFASIFTASAALIAIWTVAPDSMVTPAWMVIAIALVEFGVAFNARAPRFTGLAVASIVCGRVLVHDLAASPWLSAFPAAAAFYWLWYRFEEPFRRILFWIAPLMLASLFGAGAGIGAAPAAWAAIAVGLAAVSHRFGIEDAEPQSYLLAALACVSALFFDVSPHPRPAVLIGAAAACYAAQALTRRDAGRVYLSIVGSLLVAGTIYAEVSGGLLTVFWALEGLVLLGCGFALRNRALRLEGLAALFLCILKVFVYDLRNLETVYRILSFIALGVILLAVSWIYTRFSRQLKRLL